MFRLGTTYTYARQRKDFGRPTEFKFCPAQMVYDVGPDPILKASHVRLQFSDMGTQLGTELSEHEVLTYKTPYKRRNDLQVDTGWPKEVYVNDPEQVVRFRKKQEKDERLIRLLPGFQKRLTNALDQNNLVNIYQRYFTDPDWEMVPDQGPMWSRTLNVFEPFHEPDLPVSSLCWSSLGNGDRIAVAHADLTFQKTYECGNCSYIWSIGNQIKPYAVLQTPFQCTVLEFSEKDPEGLAGGLINGQVVFFDLRQGHKPVSYSPLYTSFRNPVTSVLWTSSKTGTECFSSSMDGQIMWWDVRNLEEPTDAVLLDFTKGEDQEFGRALGVSCMEFQPTIPTRFMVGTEAGIVLNGNRKGKTLQEKFSTPIAAHVGPVRSIERNPVFLKNYITAGDWTVRIWSEDCKESSILWTFFHPCELTKACWSPVKQSVFFVTRTDGVIDSWDLMVSQDKPVYSTKVSSFSLKTMKFHEDGEMIAVGDAAGKTHIVEYSRHMHEIAAKTDKNVIAALFEREAKREKIIEAKVRELKLKAQQRPAEEAEEGDTIAQLAIEKASREFAHTISVLESGGIVKTTEEYDT